ncbi:hypothetical protein FHS29_003728 [Saccharothrix tamanrassetensis]|uniref:Uncharacterized protein n=1 Tax=Saccharothrix tamanrassetensis TaxID=1051531 RepID=A0A841CMA5_9PSEU|nr:hypothetical protein [Saccharothrix tamanrassetensis]MBB5957135.1 hypothetical protein [Saccharothrix tamanrassetensis]
MVPLPVLGPVPGSTGSAVVDELVVTTIAHDHRDRVGSHELLAEAWATATEGDLR